MGQAYVVHCLAPLGTALELRHSFVFHLGCALSRLLTPTCRGALDRPTPYEVLMRDARAFPLCQTFRADNMTWQSYPGLLPLLVAARRVLLKFLIRHLQVH